MLIGSQNNDFCR